MSDETPPAASPSATRRGTETRARSGLVQVRCTPDELAAITAKAERAGMTVGAFMRHQALGQAGPRAMRRPMVDRTLLAQILGQLGKWGSNVNQLARAFNTDDTSPAAIELAALRAEITTMRELLMTALGHTPKGW